MTAVSAPRESLPWQVIRAATAHRCKNLHIPRLTSKCAGPKPRPPRSGGHGNGAPATGEGSRSSGLSQALRTLGAGDDFSGKQRWPRRAAETLKNVIDFKIGAA